MDEENHNDKSVNLLHYVHLLYDLININKNVCFFHSNKLRLEMNGSRNTHIYPFIQWIV